MRLHFALAILCAAAPARSTWHHPSAADRDLAALTLGTVREALAAHAVTIECLSSSPFPGRDECAAQSALVPRLDAKNLLDIVAGPCSRTPPTHCAYMVFDLGRGDDSQITVMVTTRSDRVLSPADVQSIEVAEWQGDTRD